MASALATSSAALATSIVTALAAAAALAAATAGLASAYGLPTACASRMAMPELVPRRQARGARISLAGEVWMGDACLPRLPRVFAATASSPSAAPDPAAATRSGTLRVGRLWI